MVPVHDRNSEIRRSSRGKVRVNWNSRLDEQIRKSNPGRCKDMSRLAVLLSRRR